MRIASCVLLVCLNTLGQSFEVASIKIHPEPIHVSMDARVSGTRVIATAVTLLDLITNAYGVSYDQISGGPGWIKTDHFDLEARAPGEQAVTANQMRQIAFAKVMAEVHGESDIGKRQRVAAGIGSKDWNRSSDTRVRINVHADDLDSESAPDLFQDEDYYGMGVCHWELIAAGAELKIRNLDFSPSIFLGDIKSGKTISRYFSNRAYRDYKGGVLVDIGNEHREEFQEEASDTFSTTLTAKEIQP